MEMRVVVPLRTGGGLNDREHWAQRAKRVKRERWAVGMVLNVVRWLGQAEGIYEVELTRVSPSARKLDDDNLAGALKASRDEVARWLGVDDGDGERVKFNYLQRKGRWGVEVVVRVEEGG